MSFLNDLGKKISGAAELATDKAKDFAELASDKAKDLAEMTKTNYDISVLQKQMDSDYTEIGKQMFQLEKDNPLSPVHELCQKIVVAQQTIADMNAKLQPNHPEEETSFVAPSTAQSKTFCPNCGSEVVGGGKFCPGCGTPIA